MAKKLGSRLLILALVVGALVRLPQLHKYPSGFTPDEAAFGYNAHSLLLTGKDEWGKNWYELFSDNLRSFGDYKLPLYAFLTVPSVKLLGLSEYSTRLPSAVVGSLAIVAIYLLSKSIWPSQNLVAGISSILMATSSWHVALSRGAFEANLGTFFLPMAADLLLRGMLIRSALFFSLAFYSYHSSKLLVPIVVLLLLIFKKPSVQKMTGFILALSILCLPGVVSMVGVGASRVGDVSIFSPTDSWKSVSDRRFEAVAAHLPDPVSRIFSNKATSLIQLVVTNFLSYFSFEFLFTKGVGEGTYGMTPGRGVLYLALLPGLCLFIANIIKNNSKDKWLLLILVVTSSLPAVFAKGPGYAGNRAATMIPFLLLACAYGISKLKKNYAIALLLGVSFSFAFFLEDYLYHSPKKISEAMLFGRREAFERMIPIANGFDEVHISRSLSEPHIFLAFYQRTDPRLYQSASGGWLVFEEKGMKFLDQLDGYWLGNFRFGDLNKETDSTKRVLQMGKPEEFNSSQEGYFTIVGPTGRELIKVAPKI